MGYNADGAWIDDGGGYATDNPNNPQPGAQRYYPQAQQSDIRYSGAAPQQSGVQQALNPSWGQNALGQYDYNGQSQNPGSATGWYGSQQAAQDAWYKANPQYAQQNTAANAGQSNAPAPPQAPDFSALFQPGYMGTPSTIDPAMVQAQNMHAAQGQASQYDMNGLLSQWMNPSGSNANTNLDPNLVSSLGAGNTIQALLQGFAPQAQKANNNLNQMLANFGVGGGQAVGASSQLQAQLGSALAPAIASAIQNSQGNTLQAGMFQGSQGLQQSLANAQMQAANYGQRNAAVDQALGMNTANSQQMGLANLANRQGANATNVQNQLTAALNNQASQNAAAQYNASTMNSTNAANIGQYNQSQTQMLNNLLNEYYARLGAFNNLNTGTQSAGNQNAVNYGQEVTTSDPWGQLMGAVGAAASSYTGMPRPAGSAYQPGTAGKG